MAASTDEQMDGHEVGIEIGLLEKALVQFTASIPRTLFVSTSGLKKEFKAKREIDPVFPCQGGTPRGFDRTGPCDWRPLRTIYVYYVYMPGSLLQVLWSWYLATFLCRVCFALFLCASCSFFPLFRRFLRFRAFWARSAFSTFSAVAVLSALGNVNLRFGFALARLIFVQGL